MIVFYLQFALVHYFTKVGAGEYYLEELEEIICMEEERRRRQKLGLPTDNGALQDSVSELFSPKNSGYRKQT